MNNPFKNITIKSASVSITKHFFGKTHFIAQTAADLILEGEATIISAITKQDKEALREERLTATFQTQEQIKAVSTALYNTTLDKLRKSKPVTQDTLLLNVIFE